MNFPLNIPAVKRRAWAEIDLDSAEFNFNAIKNSVSKHGKGTKICCVIKANAYGHSAVQLARLYESLKADYLAVSNIEEALQLRQHKIKLPILILGYTPSECVRLLAENSITQCVYSYEYGMELSEKASEASVELTVHLKLDTGMGRIGFLCRDCADNELEKALAVAKAPSLKIEGAFTHFAVADDGKDGIEYSKQQFEHFKKAVEFLKQNGVEVEITHCANSAATFHYPEFNLDMVRVGVVLYGLKPSEKVDNLPELKTVMSLHSVISHIKLLREGQGLSYGCTFTADRDMTVATVPIGYADGFRRMNSNGYRLTVNGRPAPIIGRVCMDQLMLDVSGIDCSVGDSVTVFGSEYPSTADEIAKINGTINYEIVCNVGERVPRAFLKNGKIIGWQDSIIGENFNKF